MPKDVNLLDDLHIASPCSVPWSTMKGDDRVRFCDHCRLHVYNFAELTRVEAEALIHQTEGRLCGMLHRRRDGTILTRDCPVGLAAVRLRLRRGLAMAAAAVVALIGTVSSLAGPHRQTRLRDLQPMDRICKWLAPPGTAPVAPGNVRLAGRIVTRSRIAIGSPSVPPVGVRPAQSTATPDTGGK